MHMLVPGHSRQTESNRTRSVASSVDPLGDHRSLLTSH